MIFYDSILVAYNIFVVETFEDMNFFFDGSNILFTDGYFLHCNENAVIEVDTLIDFTIGSFSYLLD